MLTQIDIYVSFFVSWGIQEFGVLIGEDIFRRICNKLLALYIYACIIYLCVFMQCLVLVIINKFQLAVI